MSFTFSFRHDRQYAPGREHRLPLYSGAVRSAAHASFRVRYRTDTYGQQDYLQTMSDVPPLTSHYLPHDFSDRAAYAFVRFLRFFADAFFAHRYGHRAVVLETVAAVPGMVGGTLQHLRSLHQMEDDHGRIHKLLDEAENERIHFAEG
jgi:hypothetical protein